MNRRRFEMVVEKAIALLPRELREHMDNVQIIVEDFPSNDVVEQEGLESPYDLFGLYEGIPLTERDSGYSGALPDRIFIYQRPIEEACETEQEMVEEVRITVAHEVAHFFGIDEDRLEELGFE
jgi:predicted Zn-dependent protease with MMP-like domain